jgi:hypothetical protein
MRKIVNPKTLKGQDKVNRMLDLMGKMNTLNESKSLSELELIKKGPNGVVYGIVRENHDYFIKTSNKPYGKFLSEDFQYVGGLQNKSTEKYHSYAEALKHLNIKFDMLNESYGVENNNNISDGKAIAGGAGFGFVLEKEEEIILDDDIKEQKKVLKVDVPASATPTPPSTPEAPVEDDVEVDEFDVSDDTEGLSDVEDTEDTDTTGDEGTGDLGDDEITKKIQKLTGKIGQMLRDSENVDPKLEKYVINSIISALHLDEMDEGDKEDIVAKFEGEDEEDSFGSDTDEDTFGDETSTEEGSTEDTSSEEVPDETSEEGSTEELSEDDDKMTKKEVLNITEKQMDMLHEKGICECGNKCLVYRDSDVKDSVLLDKIAETEKDCVFISKKQMDMLHEKGICECGDITLKYKEGKKEKNEGRVFSKKQLLETFLRKSTKNSINKVLKERKEICEDCGGYKGSNMVEGMMCECSQMYEGDDNGFIDGRKKIDVAKPYGKITADDFSRLRSMKRKRHIDEDEMGVMDALETRQGYLSATRDLDRDFDGIPNRLDLDNNSDGELDFSMNNRNSSNDDFIELDIDFLRSNAPVKEPGIKTPTTRPGTGTDWDKIKRPKADPKPKADVDQERIRPSYRRRGMFR